MSQYNQVSSSTSPLKVSAVIEFATYAHQSPLAVRSRGYILSLDHSPGPTTTPGGLWNGTGTIIQAATGPKSRPRSTHRMDCETALTLSHRPQLGHTKAWTLGLQSTGMLAVEVSRESDGGLLLLFLLPSCLTASVQLERLASTALSICWRRRSVLGFVRTSIKLILNNCSNIVSFVIQDTLLCDQSL